jgi:hypothetical protein
VLYVPSITVSNARQGFVEAEVFSVRQLPDPINDAATFGYLTGWRNREILGLTWSIVDRAERKIRERCALALDQSTVGSTLPARKGRWAAFP